MRLVFLLLISRIQMNQITVTSAGAVLVSAMTVGNAGRKTTAAVMSACLHMQPRAEAIEPRQEVNVGHAPVNEEILWPYLSQLDRLVEDEAILRELEALRRTQARAFEDLRYRDGWNIHLPGYAPEERERRRREGQNEKRCVERLNYPEALHFDRERQARLDDERER